jgi:hypothetical protein
VSDDTEGRRRRGIEVMALVVMAVATVGSAWCAYQAAQWNGGETELGRESSDQRVVASQQFALATQTIAYDANTIAQYAQALAEENDRLAEFIRTSLAREQLLPLIDEWKATVEAGGTPTRLLDDTEYLDGLLQPYRDSLAESEALSNESLEAGDTGNNYVLVTLLLAVSLFFAGITNSFRDRGVRLALLAGSGLALAYAASRLADLKVF